MWEKVICFALTICETEWPVDLSQSAMGLTLLDGPRLMKMMYNMDSK